MRIIAYAYTPSTGENIPNRYIWGWEVDEIYQDLGDRPQLNKLLSDCQRQPTDYLLIRTLEELGDSLGEVCDRLEILEVNGVKIIALENSINYQDQTINKADILRLFQQIRQNQHSQKIRQAHARNRLNILPPPGRVPYGYKQGKDRYVLDRSTAPMVKDFFDKFLLYGSLRGAVRYLDKKYYKKISVTTGKRWLINPVYRGDLQYKNGEIITDTHVPIISREEAAQIDRLLKRNSRLPPRSASAARSLAGLVRCQACQSTLVVAKVTAYRKTKEYLYLRPQNCPRQPKCSAISYEQVWQQAISQICQELAPAIARLTIPNMDGVKAGMQGAIAGKEELLKQLPNLLTTGILDEETVAFRAYKIRTEIAQLQNQLAQLPPVNLLETAQTVALPQFWLDLSETERRFYLREFIKQIDIIRLSDQDWDLQIIFIF